MQSVALYDIIHGPSRLTFLGLFCFYKFINNVITPLSTIFQLYRSGLFH